MQEDPHQGAGPKLWHCVERGGFRKSSFDIFIIVNYCFPHTFSFRHFSQLSGDLLCAFSFLVWCDLMSEDEGRSRQSQPAGDAGRHLEKGLLYIAPSKEPKGQKTAFLHLYNTVGICNFFLTDGAEILAFRD